MAQDFPEEKYNFKVQKDEHTFGQNLLHAAALDFVLIRRISGSDLGRRFSTPRGPVCGKIRIDFEDVMPFGIFGGPLF